MVIERQMDLLLPIQGSPLSHYWNSFLTIIVHHEETYHHLIKFINKIKKYVYFNVAAKWGFFRNMMSVPYAT